MSARTLAEAYRNWMNTDGCCKAPEIRVEAAFSAGWRLMRSTMLEAAGAEIARLKAENERLSDIVDELQIERETT